MKRKREELEAKETEQTELFLAKKREAVLEHLQREQSAQCLWEAMEVFAGCPMQTMKGLEFFYTIRGGELFVDRKEKSITRSTVELAYERAKQMNGIVKGPKKLGVFGASYLYPIFQKIGVIAGKEPENTDLTVDGTSFTD